jgi:hypothetical protein
MEKQERKRSLEGRQMYKGSALRFEVLTAMTILLLVFWIAAALGLSGGYQHFGKTYSLDLEP